MERQSGRNGNLIFFDLISYDSVKKTYYIAAQHSFGTGYEGYMKQRQKLQMEPKFYNVKHSFLTWQQMYLKAKARQNLIYKTTVIIENPNVKQKYVIVCTTWNEQNMELKLKQNILPVDNCHTSFEMLFGKKKYPGLYVGGKEFHLQKEEQSKGLIWVDSPDLVNIFNSTNITIKLYVIATQSQTLIQNMFDRLNLKDINQTEETAEDTQEEMEFDDDEDENTNEAVFSKKFQIGVAFCIIFFILFGL